MLPTTSHTPPPQAPAGILEAASCCLSQGRDATVLTKMTRHWHISAALAATRAGVASTSTQYHGGCVCACGVGMALVRGRTSVWRSIDLGSMPSGRLGARWTAADRPTVAPSLKLPSFFRTEPTDNFREVCPFQSPVGFPVLLTADVTPKPKHV